MSKNFCWGCQTKEEEKVKPYVVVLMVSRNKDNKHLEDFHERRRARLCRYDSDKICKDFARFRDDGRLGEMSRCYISLNARDIKKVQKILTHELIDTDEFNFNAIEGIVAGFAARKECAAESKWFFDFDCTDEDKVEEFCRDIFNISPKNTCHYQNTPHGFAVIVDHGFDTRELMKKWSDIVTLKRDDLICTYWGKKEW